MDSNDILCIDGDFLLYYSTAPIRVKELAGIDEEGNEIYSLLKDKDNKQIYRERTLQECLDSIDDILRNLFVKTNIFYYIGFLGGRVNFRKSITTSYKANREKLVKPTFIGKVRDYLVSQYGFTIVENIEADDAVNICKKQLINNNVVIVSPDKDILNCVGGTHFNPKKMEWVSTSIEDANYNFYASLIIGDVADNIKGQM